MGKTQEQIRYNMQRIRNKDSEIEILLRNALWRKGYRYRKNIKNVYGHPDIAFIGKKIAIFCDSEFWHGYDWEHRKEDFKKHREFWLPKIENNIERDKEVNERLESEGWTVLRFWGEEIKRDTAACVEKIEQCLFQA